MAKKVYALDLGSNRFSVRVRVSLSVYINHTPQAGIEPATFRLTAESSNHWATEDYIYIVYYIWFLREYNSMVEYFFCKEMASGSIPLTSRTIKP